ncbi:MAG: type II toxin-antitoxin system RelB/DinJ family antitoxin [Synergistaceae bacterium]|nr:type II toxin-antitoxin system RelB/DinJ family antitoxin [Synergistaceae bacterium]
MPVSTIITKVDEDDKRNFSEFCNSVGLNVSSAINIFIKTVIREKRIPFMISQNADPFYSPENQAYVMKSVKELREGKGRPHELIDPEE